MRQWKPGGQKGLRVEGLATKLCAAYVSWFFKIPFSVALSRIRKDKGSSGMGEMWLNMACCVHSFGERSKNYGKIRHGRSAETLKKSGRK
jgi:hypothetical protein